MHSTCISVGWCANGIEFTNGKRPACEARRPKTTPQSLFASKVGNLAMLLAMRRASSSKPSYKWCLG